MCFQIIYHRFGKPAHIVFCIVALLTNLVTITSLVLAAKSSVAVITKDASDEFIMIVMAILFGSYCFIGGLGTTFYISYFNTALTFVSLLVFIVQFSYLDNGKSYTTTESMYDALTCMKALNKSGNYNDAILTFRSTSGAMYGLSLLFMATSLSFCDQANWQSRIAAKPAQGVMGFFIAAFLYFSIPMAIGLPTTFGYLSMSYNNNGTHLLSNVDINNGNISFFLIRACG